VRDCADRIARPLKESRAPGVRAPAGRQSGQHREHHAVARRERGGEAGRGGKQEAEAEAVLAERVAERARVADRPRRHHLTPEAVNETGIPETRNDDAGRERRGERQQALPKAVGHRNQGGRGLRGRKRLSGHHYL
jgi:hypothetical protein